MALVWLLIIGSIAGSKSCRDRIDSWLKGSVDYVGALSFFKKLFRRRKKGLLWATLASRAVFARLIQSIDCSDRSYQMKGISW